MDQFSGEMEEIFLRVVVNRIARVCGSPSGEDC